ncbi:MAG TPA: tetratricopeptide repeat protein, partial [Lacipirellulaceae bacterium]|nr:tetratricopeptide repeat protein [Lacipirellulaceae bacterium]
MKTGDTHSSLIVDKPRPIVSDSLRPWMVATILGFAIAAVYGHALHAPFLFDDQISITENPSIQSLWPPVGTSDQPGPLNPPLDLPTSGRPLANLSFAINYFIGGFNPLGYHVVNVVIHFLSTCLLFAVVRRTLRLPYFNGRFDVDASWLALAAALLWALHPLQTEAVIYTTQRTELMMALFYLATIYCSLRYWSADNASLPPEKSSRTSWLSLAVLSCACGMASKEVMASAPIIVLLFERTFIAGSIAKAFRESRPLYIGLFATWIVLFALNIGGPRSGSAGFHFDVPAYQWWLTQCEVLLMYLKLAIWPSPLLCEYELPYFKTALEAGPYLIPVLLLGVVTLVLLVQNRPSGFLLTFVAAVLAPTFIVPILTETAAERRMYLPLASLVVLAIVGSYLLIQNLRTHYAARQSTRWSLAVPAVAMVVAILGGVASASRLSDYYDEIKLWRQVEQAQPNNYLAHYNLGLLLNYAGQQAESFDELRAAVDANPNYPNARSALGFALIHAGRLPEAIDSLNAALAINPNHVGALNNLGIALVQMGRPAEAVDVLQQALRVDPHHADARNNLGRALTAAGRPDEARKLLEGLKSDSPDDPDVLNNLGSTLAAQGQLPEAIATYKRALELRPDFASAHNNLAIALFNSGDVSGAVEHFRRFLELNPNDAAAHFNLGNVVAAQGDFKQAVPLYEETIRLQPNAAEPHFSLGAALVKLDRGTEAIEQFQQALRLNPDLLAIYPNLADALAATHQTADAIEIAQRGITAARSAGNS